MKISITVKKGFQIRVGDFVEYRKGVWGEITRLSENLRFGWRIGSIQNKQSKCILLNSMEYRCHKNRRKSKDVTLNDQD